MYVHIGFYTSMLVESSFSKDLVSIDICLSEGYAENKLSEFQKRTPTDEKYSKVLSRVSFRED